MGLKIEIIILLALILILPVLISATPVNKPYCIDNPPQGYSSWYDDNGPIQFRADCMNCSAVYKPGTVQGWYSSCNSHLIKLTPTRSDGSFFLTCDETDGGNKHFVRGITSYKENSAMDFCVWDDGNPTTGEDGSKIVENYCDEQGNKITDTFPCPYGCKEGACTKITPQNNTPIDVVENLQKEGCEGCLFVSREENKCYPFGYRTQEKTFCSNTNSSFIEQKKKDLACENNFECSSNICKESVCKNLPFLKRIANWFSNLF